jgi:hypothetical protein
MEGFYEVIGWCGCTWMATAQGRLAMTVDRRVEAPMGKSFLVLFFKKEPLR